MPIQPDIQLAPGQWHNLTALGGFAAGTMLRFQVINQAVRVQLSSTEPATTDEGWRTPPDTDGYETPAIEATSFVWVRSMIEQGEGPLITGLQEVTYVPQEAP